MFTGTMSSRSNRRRIRATGSRRLSSTLFGALIGSAFAYLFDPNNGRARRARLRDKALHISHKADHKARAIGHDIAHRLQGTVYETMARLRKEQPDDATLHERIRSELGHVCSHPHGISVSCQDGVARLEGPISQREVSRVIRRVARVRGVQRVQNALTVHQDASHVPALQ